MKLLQKCELELIAGGVGCCCYDNRGQFKYTSHPVAWRASSMADRCKKHCCNPPAGGGVGGATVGIYYWALPASYGNAELCSRVYFPSTKSGECGGHGYYSTY